MKFHLNVLVCAVLLATAPPLLAQPAASPPNPKKFFFHGKLLSVDSAAQTITVAGKKPHTFHVTPTTKITDQRGNPSDLDAAAVGKDVGGYYIKDGPSGQMTVSSLRLRTKTEAASSATTMMPSSSPVITPSSVPSTMETTPSGGSGEVHATPSASPTASPTPYK